MQFEKGRNTKGMFLIEPCFRDAVYHLACFNRLVNLVPVCRMRQWSGSKTVPGLVITEFVNNQYWSGLINSSQEIKAILNCNSCIISHLDFQKPGTSSIKPTVHISAMLHSRPCYGWKGTFCVKPRIYCKLNWKP